MSDNNSKFAEAVTSTAFNLTLSKTMIGRLITAARPTLADLARDILADKWDRFPEGDYTFYSTEDWQREAQLYLDNLADGYDCPDELIEWIAKGVASVRLDELRFARERITCPDRKHDFDYDYDYSDDLDEFYAANPALWNERAAESYVPAVGGVK